MLPPSPSRLESWAVIRARMLRETERFIEEALRNPEKQVQIPCVKAGTGSFSRVFAQLFWAQVLGAS
jgi:hypothetical protein